MNTPNAFWSQMKPTALLVLADGTILEGIGFGAQGEHVAEVCFNTAMTGYQEIITDPSYTGQIVTFTFPHIGNVGINIEDFETLGQDNNYGACGVVFSHVSTEASNWRSSEHLNTWLKARNVIGISGIDTRALTTLIRDNGMPNAVIAHNQEGVFDRAALLQKAKAWQGLDGTDLVPEVTTQHNQNWSQTIWQLEEGYGDQSQTKYHVVAIDYGVKLNILRLLANSGCKVTIVPAKTSAEDILALNPDGVFLSNGPGDPAATGEYAVPTIQKILAKKIPLFGICLGHQMLALALGGKTQKMHQGHHGANHPVKDTQTGKVEITSMNHGFAVDRKSLPADVIETHVSLFDGSNCGLALKSAPVFSVQHHPEASPGPQDSHYLFDQFKHMMSQYKAA